jgi:hypothetical protein|tara:strand:- start:602 stop:760 length:159 start_codon:yes stop_codon:yes gene_type:complete
MERAAAHAEQEKQEMQKQIHEMQLHMQQMFKKLKKENSLIVATSNTKKNQRQ